MSKIVALACVWLVACAAARPPQLVPASALPTEAAPAPQLELAPPSTVASTPRPRPREYYAVPMIALDVVLLVIAIPAMDENAAMAAGTAGAYLFGAPLIHDAYGNRRQAGRSFLRRVGYPVLLGIGGGAVGSLAARDCESLSCAFAPLTGAVIGAGVGAIVAVVHDWTKAYRER